jgi:hypothetical protein
MGIPAQADVKPSGPRRRPARQLRIAYCSSTPRTRPTCVPMPVQRKRHASRDRAGVGGVLAAAIAKVITSQVRAPSAVRDTGVDGRAARGAPAAGPRSRFRGRPHLAGDSVPPFAAAGRSRAMAGAGRASTPRREGWGPRCTARSSGARGGETPIVSWARSVGSAPPAPAPRLPVSPVLRHSVRTGDRAVGCHRRVAHGGKVAGPGFPAARRR